MILKTVYRGLGMCLRGRVLGQYAEALDLVLSTTTKPHKNFLSYQTYFSTLSQMCKNWDVVMLALSQHPVLGSHWV